MALAKRMVAALGLVNARGEKEFSKHKHLFIKRWSEAESFTIFENHVYSHLKLLYLQENV